MPYPSAPATSLGPELPERELPEVWAEQTARGELPQASQAFAGFGRANRLDIEKLGVVARALVKVKLEAETTDEAAGETIPAPGAPWSILEAIELQANGVSGVIQCSGTLLECRERIVYRTPVHAVLSDAHSEPGVSTPVKTAFIWELIYEVPIAEDLTDLEGVVLAQSEQTALSLRLQWATEGEMFTTLTHPLAKATGEVAWQITWFSIGTYQEGKRTVIALPDLQTLHGLVERSTPLVAEGNQEAPLTPTAGDLLRYYIAAYNGYTSTFDPLAWVRWILQYGGNQKPIVFEPASFLVEENAKAYKERLDVNGVKYLILDTTLDDAIRDAIRPMMLSELKSIVGIPSAPAANSRIVSAQESLYPAAA